MKIDTIRSVFGSRAFTAKEARVALGRNAKLALSRLVVSGRLVREGRGKYRVAEPEARDRIDAAYFALLRGRALRLPVALDGPDAVSAWTGGRYTIHPASLEDHALWLATTPTDASKVRVRLEEQGWVTGTADKWPAGRGAKAILRVVPRLRIQRLNGEPVISKAAVKRLIQSQPAAYGGAGEWLLEG